MTETPKLLNSSYLSTNYHMTTTDSVGAWPSVIPYNSTSLSFWGDSESPLKENQVHQPTLQELHKLHLNRTTKKEEPIMPMATQQRRIVQVFIADSDGNLPIEKSLLYTGAQKLTDATDQELFFEIEINSLLKDHNELRAKTLNKKASEKNGKDTYLEPIKIRDLTMNVVTVAAF